MNKKFYDELRSFDDRFEGGYFEGDPLNPLARSSYGQLGFLSTLHVTYLLCIKPYVNDATVSLEIGPGRGAWTKLLLPSQEVYALDAKPAEDNRFFEYLEHPDNVKYFQVNDFDCDMLPEDHFTYMFSYGCLCHVSFDGISEYAANIYPKMKRGSNCFWMVADFNKWNTAISNIHDYSIWAALKPRKRRYLPLKWLFQYIMQKNRQEMLSIKSDEPPRGQWQHAGIERTCSLLTSVGYQIVDPDVGSCLRDPVIHFMKP